MLPYHPVDFSEDEIEGRIYVQACALFSNDMLGRESQVFMGHALDAQNKIRATHYHLHNYLRLQKNYVELAKSDPSFGIEASMLVFELEAFLFQIKSSLDLLVKTVTPVVGRGKISTHTFGSSGEDFLRGIGQLKKDKKMDAFKIGQLENLIGHHKPAWMDRTIKLRDQFTHYTTIWNHSIKATKDKEGRVSVSLPLFEGTSVESFLRSVYSGNLVFHQDFLSVVSGLRFLSLQLAPSTDEHVARISGRADMAKYVRYGWTFTGQTAVPPQSLSQ
jgi:hypothetical protein